SPSTLAMVARASSAERSGFSSADLTGFTRDMGLTFCSRYALLTAGVSESDMRFRPLSGGSLAESDYLMSAPQPIYQQQLADFTHFPVASATVRDPGWEAVLRPAPLRPAICVSTPRPQTPFCRAPACRR